MAARIPSQKVIFNRYRLFLSTPPVPVPLLSLSFWHLCSSFPRPSRLTGRKQAHQSRRAMCVMLPSAASPCACPPMAVCWSGLPVVPFLWPVGTWRFTRPEEASTGGLEACPVVDVCPGQNSKLLQRWVDGIARHPIFWAASTAPGTARYKVLDSQPASQLAAAQPSSCSCSPCHTPKARIGWA